MPVFFHLLLGVATMFAVAARVVPLARLLQPVRPQFCKINSIIANKCGISSTGEKSDESIFSQVAFAPGCQLRCHVSNAVIEIVTGTMDSISVSLRGENALKRFIVTSGLGGIGARLHWYWTIC